MSIKTGALALGAALALLVSAGAQPAAAKKRSSAVRTATRMLTGVYLTIYTSGDVTGASASVGTPTHREMVSPLAPI